MSASVVVVVGAAGGLGAAIARAFAQPDTHIVLVARTLERLAAVASAVGDGVTLMTADVTDRASLEALATACEQRFGRVDVVINAVGNDVRKPFLDHTPDEVEALVATNLLGAIWTTRAFLPLMLRQQTGVIVHLGGFADGRLAFPFYTVDSATRAGVRGFVDALNREIEGSHVTVSYFCPAPADTDAERPYHPIWREMGMAIASPDAVAAALLRAVQRRDRVAMMGVGTRFFARLNSVSSTLADVLLMRGYRRILARHLGAR